MANLELSFESGASLSVRRFSVRESVSACFEATVWARSPDPSLDLGALVGRPAALRVETGYAYALLGGARAWTGVCSHAEQTAAEPTGLSTYRLRIRPNLWILGHRTNHRIFQHKSIPDIADVLLGEWGLVYDWKIDRGAYPKLEFKVQYGESDYHFLCRLLEEAGIAFTFPDEGAGGTRLTLGDALHAAAARAAPPLPCVDNPNQASEKEYVTKVRLADDVRPGAWTARDHDFRKPAYPLFGKAKDGGAVEERLEQYLYTPAEFLLETGKGGDTPVADDKGVARREEDFGHARSERALAGARADKKRIAFETNVADLWPGVIVLFDGHANGEIDNKRLLVTDFAMEGEPGRAFRMVGTAVPAEQPYRPALETPRPRIKAVECAMVVGPRGEEIHTDEFGRVRVQFPWDREGKADDGSSCWMRVSQGWAGAGYGMMHIPRIGQEVLVAFVDGNPDAPVVLGRVYDEPNRVPYPLPAEKTKSTWKSDTSPHSGGFNEIMFEDKKGEELVYLQAEKNQRTLVKNDETITVGHDRSKKVGRNETDTTGHDRVEVTGVDRSQQVGRDRTTVIGGDRAHLIKGGSLEVTTGDHLLTVVKDRHVWVKAEKREGLLKDSHLHVGGGRNEQVGGTLSVSTMSLQEKAGKKAAVESGDETHILCNQILVGEGGISVTLKGPGGFVAIDAVGVTIVGTLVDINVGGSPGTGSGAHPSLPEDPKDKPRSGPAPGAADDGKVPDTYGKAIKIEGDEAFRKKTIAALDAIEKTPTGAKMLQSIEDSGQAVTIKPTTGGNGASPVDGSKAARKADGTPDTGTGSVVKFNPDRTQVGDGSEDWQKRPPAVGLAHEMVHAYHNANGTNDFTPAGEDMAVGVPPYDTNDVTENKMRAEWDPPQPTRPHY